MDSLIAALQAREAVCRMIVSRLRDADHDSQEVHVLREAAELIGCLRRLLPACPAAVIHRAFGAPGDFGYETPIGDALSNFYRSVRS